MTRFAQIVESKLEQVDLTESDARLLNDLGRRLASSSTYWRQDQTEASAPKSVIRCTFDGSAWAVFFQNVIGVVKVNDLQITINPKIPLMHFLYLMGYSDFLPRFVAESVEVTEANDLLELIAHWFIWTVEAILRRELVHDYMELQDELSAIRGQLDSLQTAQKFYAGRLGFECLYDEFSQDTPLNRLLRAATARTAGQPSFSAALRRRAFRALERFGAISSLRSADLLARTDRRTAHYADGIRLAYLLLSGEARGLENGLKGAWSFLMPTAGPIEDGVRAVLAEQLRPDFVVSKRALRLMPTNLTVNPDLVFSPGNAVGDIKYKTFDKEWPRADLYQSVAFAAAYKARRAIVMSFGASESSSLPQVAFGDIDVFGVVWQTDVSPQLAARTAAANVAQILQTRGDTVALGVEAR